VDADKLDAAVGAWLAAQVTAGRVADEAVAVDGKSLRGAKQPDGRPVHLFSALVHKESVVIAQRQVCHKTNEITELRPLLEKLDLAGAVVTADALHTQRDHAEFWSPRRTRTTSLRSKATNQAPREDRSPVRGVFPPLTTRGLTVGTAAWSNAPSKP